MSHADPELGLDVLSELVRDPVWFVRLRAVVSFGRLSNAQAISSLLIGLTDSNRLVRLRAAEAIVELKADMAQVFEQVVATGDRYGVHAYLTALENRNLREKLKAEIDANRRISQKMRRHLQKVLQSGILSLEDLAPSESVPKDAAPAK
jgi:HEAT repeat protein